MKFVLDENLSLSLIEVLRELGFEAEHVINVGLRGCSDKKISAYAKKQQAVLITKDLEFANIMIYPKNAHYGLIVLRLPNYFTISRMKESLKEFLTKSKPEICIGTIIILEVGRFRMRSFS